jgi:hypothetical protein
MYVHDILLIMNKPSVFWWEHNLPSRRGEF